MVKLIRTKREVSQAGQTDELTARRRDLMNHRIPFFGLPLPFSRAHLRWLLFAHRYKVLGAVVWTTYPALLIVILTHWFITGIVVALSILMTAATILLANGPTLAAEFLVENIREYGLITW